MAKQNDRIFSHNRSLVLSILRIQKKRTGSGSKLHAAQGSCCEIPASWPDHQLWEPLSISVFPRHCAVVLPLWQGRQFGDDGGTVIIQAKKTASSSSFFLDIGANHCNILQPQNISKRPQTGDFPQKILRESLLWSAPSPPPVVSMFGMVSHRDVPMANDMGWP